MASVEQATGLDQMAKVISGMETIAQTIAANSEESAAAGEELSAQAESLRNTVEQFNAMVTPHPCCWRATAEIGSPILTRRTAADRISSGNRLNLRSCLLTCSSFPCTVHLESVSQFFGSTSTDAQDSGLAGESLQAKSAHAVREFGSAP